MTKDKLVEFWQGLVNSKKRFLWAIRPNLVIQKDGKGQIPVELVEGTKDRGVYGGLGPARGGLGPPSSRWVFDS